MLVQHKGHICPCWRNSHFTVGEYLGNREIELAVGGIELIKNGTSGKEPVDQEYVEHI